MTAVSAAVAAATGQSGTWRISGKTRARTCDCRRRRRRRLRYRVIILLRLIGLCGTMKCHRESRGRTPYYN